MTGILFDIKEFALNDGDGIRTTVFLKGCPLSCAWCHNPEGISPAPELYVRRNGCTDCGLCRRPCTHPECQPFGRCLHICPNNLLSVKGQEWEAEALAGKLLSGRGIMDSTGGGVTLSGGEPLMQADFCAELLSLLRGKVNCAAETSGFAAPEVFRRVISLCDHVYMDLKLADQDAHRKYCGAPNGPILENARWLRSSGIPHTFRTPLIPGITDTEENLTAIGKLTGGDPWEQLPYNDLAPAKYPCVGRVFSLDR